MDLLNLEEQNIVDERIIRAVKEMGFEQFSPIQEMAIPVMLTGKDIIGQAQTGTGKTAAFGIPLLQVIDPDNDKLQGLVLCPTRELAIQAAEEIRKFAKYMSGIRVLPVYGGQDILKQIRSLKGNVQIVVGTPGRVMDHMRRHTIKLDDLKTVVLDEADEMLNMGFREDMETILAQIPGEHQTVLFSATMPKAILDITGQFQKDAELIKTIQKELTVPAIKQYYYEVRRDNKKEVVCRLLDYYNPKRTLIFTNTKRMVEELAEELKGRGYFAEGLHGDLSQAVRDRVMSSFRSGTSDILIATDVAARGIDVDDVEAVINYDVPQDIEYYVHRIGRTGRAGRTGRSFTLVVGKEIYKIRDIERVCKTAMTARTVPSAADITQAKSGKVLAEVIDILHEKDLSEMLPIITEKLDEENCTALELAAAFLKLHIGEELVDIPVEKYEPRKRSKRDDDRRERHGRGDRHDRGRKDDRRDKKHDRKRGENLFKDDNKKNAKKRIGKKDELKKNHSDVLAESGSKKKKKEKSTGFEIFYKDKSASEKKKSKKKDGEGKKKGILDEIKKKGKPKKIDMKGNPIY